MKLKSLSICRYPTTVMMVDDNPRFLMHLSARLDPSFHFKLVTDPKEALLITEEESLLRRVLHSCFSEEGPNESFELDGQDPLIHQYYQGICLQNLLQLVQSPERFNEISVIVVDYAMPGMNGIELCRALSKHPAKKILLTGEADHRIAVDAFNEGLIHRFILKQTQENLLYETLNETIFEMQNIYFAANSRKLISALGLDLLASEGSFVNQINQMILRKQHLEYYFLNSRGALLLLDEQGKAEVLLCESAKTLESYAVIAKNNEASEYLIETLNKKTSLPCLLVAKNEDLNFQDWGRNLVPAVRLEGSNLICGLTSLLPYGFNPQNVASYSSFIQEHVKEEALF